MILFPAIDLKNGFCVRLEQGDMARATIFHRDPAEQARSFVAQGFDYLHVVDLDGAFAGRPMNAAAVDRILAAVVEQRRGRMADAAEGVTSFLEKRPAKWSLTPGKDLPDWFPWRPEPPYAP